MRLLPFGPFLICFSAIAPCFGTEAVYLTSGFRLNAASHVRTADTYVFTLDSGTVEMRSSDVDRIEVLLATADVKPPAPVRPFEPAPSAQDLVSHAGIVQGLPPAFVRSVAKIESGFRPDALSPKGARGLMQLMPGTSAYLGVQAEIPGENALGGAKYLRELLVRYHGNTALALAAYNAGPGAVAKFGGVPPYQETHRYIERVLREYERQQHSSRRPQ